MKRKIITLTIIDNKVIYYDITKNEMYESLKNVENNRNVYIFAGMFFIYFFKYFWNYNPLGKFLYSIPNCIPKFLMIFIAIILSYIEFINENIHKIADHRLIFFPSKVGKAYIRKANPQQQILVICFLAYISHDWKNFS